MADLSEAIELLAQHPDLAQPFFDAAKELVEQSTHIDQDYADRIKVRIKGSGIDGWRYRVEDAVTGRLVPAMKVELSINPDGDAIATLTVLVDEVDVETEVWRSKSEEGKGR